MKFELIKKINNARRGRLELSNGTVETPVFMPGGTYGAVKTMTSEELISIGTEIILANTYVIFIFWAIFNIITFYYHNI